MKSLKLLWGLVIGGGLALATPPLTLFLYKPFRVVLPQLNGMICADADLCVEKFEDRAEAIALIQASQEIVSESVGGLRNRPRFIFCSTEACFAAFGFGEAKAHAVEGVNAIVVGPRGWAKHIVAHELIHVWQAQELGLMAVLFGDRWIIEGMAYDLSGDPRQPLSEPFESYRQRFKQWRQAHDSKNWIQKLKLEL